MPPMPELLSELLDAIRRIDVRLDRMEQTLENLTGTVDNIDVTLDEFIEADPAADDAVGDGL